MYVHVFVACLTLLLSSFSSLIITCIYALSYEYSYRGLCIYMYIIIQNVE